MGGECGRGHNFKRGHILIITIDPYTVLTSSYVLLTAVLQVLTVCFAYIKTKSNSISTSDKTAELSQRRPRDAPNIWVPWKVLRVLTTQPATFPEICSRLLFRLILRMCVQKLKFVALPVPEIIRDTQKFGQSLDTPTLHFLSKF